MRFSLSPVFQQLLCQTDPAAFDVSSLSHLALIGHKQKCNLA